jgi:hypothetical protein
MKGLSIDTTHTPPLFSFYTTFKSTYSWEEDLYGNLSPVDWHIFFFLYNKIRQSGAQIIFPAFLADPKP